MIFLEFLPEHYLRSLSHDRSPELVQKLLWIVLTTYGLALRGNGLLIIVKRFALVTVNFLLRV